MPYGPVARIGPSCRAEVGGDDDAVYPGEDWLGRVVGGLGEPVDGLGPLSIGPRRYPLRGAPPPAHARQRVQGKLDLGVRVSIGTGTGPPIGMQKGPPPEAA